MWISVKEKMPDIDQVVMVAYPSGNGDKPTYAWGARIDDGDGWCWGTKSGYGSAIRPNDTPSGADIEVDDDYPVTHWQPLPAPPVSF